MDKPTVPSKTWHLIDHIFMEAIEMEPAGREAYLNRACAGKPGIRKIIEGMIAADEDGEGLLDETPIVFQEVGALQPGMKIGPYEIVRLLGEGGMGSVYLAEETGQITRPVALKVIYQGINAERVVRRFVLEQRTLARLSHPYIAQVFQAGMTPSGQPFFAMEFIPGKPITQYCRSQSLDLKGRLELFIKVCEAVQHAHQKRVVHRDIKPANVLVTDDQSGPIPKVIDFGIAKALNDLETTLDPEAETAETVLPALTTPGMVVGTLGYMSPEQARGDLNEIDTRTDVYSLGMLLYEMLVDTTPFSDDQLPANDMVKALRVIVEKTPLRPSERLKDEDDWRAVAEGYGVTAARLRAHLRGDLDWIVMKALEKDKERRYASASELAADVARFLRREPVLAGPPQWTYQLRKFVQRYRGQVIFGAVAVLGLVVALLSTTVGLVRTRAAEAVAREEADKAKQTLTMMNSFLSSVDPGNEGKDLKVMALLDHFVERLNKDAELQPDVEAALRHTIGETYRNLGLYSQAEQHLQRALTLRVAVLAQDHRDTLRTRYMLMVVYKELDRLQEAEEGLVRVLERQRALFGEEDTDALDSLNQYASVLFKLGKSAEGEILARQVLEGRMKVLGERHPRTLAALANLSRFLFRNGSYAEAEQLQRRLFELRAEIQGEDHPETLRIAQNLATTLEYLGKLDMAEALTRDILEKRFRVLGDKHAETLHSMNNLASILLRQKRFAEAEDLYRKTLAAKRELHGEEHRSVLAGMNNLAVALIKQGKAGEALELGRQTLAIKLKIHGPNHLSTLRSEGNLAMYYLETGDLDQAETLLRKVLESKKTRLSETHPSTLAGMGALAYCLFMKQNFVESIDLYTQLHHIERSVGARDSLQSISQVADHVREIASQKSSETTPKVLACIRLYESCLGSEHSETIKIKDEMNTFISP